MINHCIRKTVLSELSNVICTPSKKVNLPTNYTIFYITSKLYNGIYFIFKFYYTYNEIKDTKSNNTRSLLLINYYYLISSCRKFPFKKIHSSNQ